MAATLATLLALLAVHQAASWSHHHHHHKAPTVVDVVRYGQACPCAKTLPFELEVPVKPKEPTLHTYGYAIEAPPPRQPLPRYSYDYELEVPVKQHPPIKRTYGYEVQAPAPRRPLPLYSYDYELEVPVRGPEPPKLHDLETRLDRVLLPKPDCPWGAQAGALLRSARGLGYGLVEPDEEASAGRVLPLSGPTRLLPTSGPALPPREEFYDSGKTYQVVHSSPLALISGGDGGRWGSYPEDLDGLTKPWSTLPGPAYFAGSVLGRDFRSDLHFAPERPRIVDQPPAGRYQVNRYGRGWDHTHHPELEGEARPGRRSRRAVSVRFTLSEGYDSLEEEDEVFVRRPGRSWSGKYVTDRVGPDYAWKGTKHTSIVDPDDLDDLAFRHPLDRYFTNVRDWKEVVDFQPKVLRSGNYRHGFVKSPRAPWWRPSRPIYRTPVVHNAVRTPFQQEASDYHLTPAPKALPKSVYSLKILPDAAYDEEYKVVTVRPKTFGHVAVKDTHEKIVYDDNYRPNGFDSEFVGNELHNRFNGRFQDQRLSSSSMKGYSPAVVPYFGRLSTYTLGPFVTGKAGNEFNNIRDSVFGQDIFPTKSLTDAHSEEDFSLDEVDRQLLEEEKRAFNKKVDNIPEEDTDFDKTSKPLPSDVYSLKVLPDPVIDDHFSLEEIDKVQMISETKDSSPPVSEEFSPDLAPLRKLPIGNGLNILPNNDFLPGTSIFASFNTMPSGNKLPTTEIVPDTLSNTPDLLYPSPNAFGDYAYDLSTMPGFVSGKMNQLNAFSSLLSDEFHLLDRGPVKLHEKKNIKELNSKAPEELNRVFFDGERHQTEAEPKNIKQEPELLHWEDVATVASTGPVTDALPDSVSHETEGKAIQDATGGSQEAVKQESEDEPKDVHSLLASEKEIKSEEILTGEALPNAPLPVEKVESSGEVNTFTEGQVAEDNLLAENNEALFANSVQNSKEQQEDLLEANSREEAIINENQAELLGTADDPALTVVEELGSAAVLGPSSAEPERNLNAVDTPQLSEKQLDTEAVEEALTGAGDAGTQKVVTTIVPLEALRLDDHHQELEAVHAGEDVDNRPWYGLWYGHGNDVHSEALPKLHQLHDAILERNKHDGEETDHQEEIVTISSEQTTESSLSPGHKNQEIHKENSPVTDVPVMYHHYMYPQETETKAPEAVFDYYPARVSTGKVHQPYATEDEIEVHNEEWPSYRNTYSLPHLEERTHDSPSRGLPTASSVSRPQQSWSYPDHASNHYGEKWGVAPTHQPSTYSHFSKSDRHKQPNHELASAPKFGSSWGNPKYYSQHPNSMPTELTRGNTQRSDRHHYKVRGESYANRLEN